jgi:hypothetical protein
MTGGQPNTKLRMVIERAGLSNEALARRVVQVASENGIEAAYNHISVRRWLDGSRPRGLVPQFIATALSRKLGEPVTLAGIGMDDVDGALVLNPAYPENTELSIRAVLALVRADVAGSLTAISPSIATDAWPDLMVRWLTVPERGLLGPRELISASPAEAVRITTDVFSQLDYRFGGGHARRAMVTYFESEVAPALRSANHDSPAGRDLLAASAALLRLIAWTAYDSGLHGAAQRYFTQALRLAQAAGDRALGGRILAGMSHQANFLGHYEHAVNLARAAAYGARGQATPTAMALFHAMEARALASRGDKAACQAALHEAERWFSSRTPENDPYWLRYFDEAELAAEHAHSFRELGLPALSREHAERALGLHGSVYVRSCSFVRTVLAESHISQGNLEHGLQLAGEVVAVAASGLRSARTIEYVRDFIRRLEPYRRQPRAEEFVATAARTLSLTSLKT